MPINSSRLMGRRKFIEVFLAGLGAAWAGFLAQRGLTARNSGGKTGPVEVALSDLPVGAARPVTYQGSPVLVMRSAESVVALSMVCTHLGCLVQWQEAQGQFYCPCHQGKFDRNGDVISGPPPVPLERVTVKVAGDRVIVGQE